MVDQLDIRILTNRDQADLNAFLHPRLTSSMFLLSNSRDHGLEDEGGRLQGCYVGAFEEGELVGVVAHFGSGNLIPQAPRHLETLWRTAMAESGHPLTGVNGPADQCAAILDALKLPPSRIKAVFEENLYQLDLADLVVPPALTKGDVNARRSTADDFEILTEWLVAYNVEALGSEENERLRQEVRERVQRGIDQGTTWIAFHRDEPVATSSFNATLDEAVQIGGVYTPPPLRCRGYARVAVAQSLLDARAAGINLAILFTGADHIAAHKSYAALGFDVIGEYAIVLLVNGDR